MASLEILPFIAVKDGNELRGGIRCATRVETATRIGKAIEACGKVLILDVDGVERNRPQLELVKKFEGRAWIDAGTRYAEGVIDILIAGADKVVLSSDTLDCLSEAEAAAELTDSLALCIRFQHAVVARHPSIGTLSLEELLRRSRDFGIGTGIVLENGGLSKIPNLLRRLNISRMELYAGPTSKERLKELELLDLKGVIVDLEEVL